MLKVDPNNGKVYAPYDFVGNLSGNATTATKATEALNNYFYVRGTSPSILFEDTDQSVVETRYVHHNGGAIGFLKADGSWSLRCADGSAEFYGTVIATNLSGSNTGDQDLSSYHNSNGETYTKGSGVHMNLKHTTNTGYSEFSMANDNDEKLVIGSIGSGYTSSSWAGSRYIYSTAGELRIKAASNLRLYSGGMSHTGNLAVTFDSSQDATFNGNISATNLSGTNTGDQTLPSDFVSKANGGTFGGGSPA